MALRMLKRNDDKTKMMDDLYIKTSSQDVRKLLLDNWRRYGFIITPHRESDSSHEPTSDDDRSCDCCVCRVIPVLKKLH